MYKLQITPQPDFTEAFEDIAQRLKLNLVKSYKMDTGGNKLYSECNIVEECKDLHELNYRIELLIRTAKQHNLSRFKISSELNENYTTNTPYKIGATYYEATVEVDITKFDKIANYIVYNNGLIVSKNQNTDKFTLTLRTPDLNEFKKKIISIIKDLKDYNIAYDKIVKEFCFLDDNIELDKNWRNNERFN